MKLSTLVLSLSMMTSGCALADWAKTVGQPQQAENKGVDMSKLSPEERAKLEAEIKEESTSFWQWQHHLQGEWNH